jgi:ferredoxin-NAD(P)+ reductase (naphthalene dioxygenase ferredoxin-specific)
MASTPADAELEFHIRVLASGVSGQIRDRVQIGDLVRISGPFGTSYLREQHSGPIVAIAGGTGLAPVRSIVRTALDKGLPGPVHLYFGVRAQRDVYGEAELRAWEAHHSNLKVHVLLSEVAQGALTDHHRAGMVTDAVRADFDSLAGFHAYLAGPPAMVDAATELLREKGVGVRDMHADAFYSAPPAQPTKRATA